MLGAGLGYDSVLFMCMSAPRVGMVIYALMCFGLRMSVSELTGAS